MVGPVPLASVMKPARGTNGGSNPLPYYLISLYSCMRCQGTSHRHVDPLRRIGVHYTGSTGLTEVTGCFKPYLHRLTETTGWFQPYLHGYGARMMHSTMGHQTSFRYGQIHRPILQSYDHSLITALRGKCYCALDCGRVTLSTTALIAFTGRHRIYGPITKPIDDWKPVELGQNVTAGNPVTPICPSMSKFRAKGTQTVPSPQKTSRRFNQL